MSGDYNHEFLETHDIVPGFLPVDMQAAANNGQYVNISLCDRVVVVLYKAVGTAGDDPVFTLQQATSAGGGGVKALNVSRLRKKIGAIASTPLWTIVTQTAAATYTDTDSAEAASIIATEVVGTDLDLNNGFKYLRLTIPDVGGNAQLGCAFYIMCGIRYTGAVNQSAIA